jgi:hypothetical protein
LPSNLYSIAEAQFYPQAVPLAIYNEQDQMVGFVMYGVDVKSGKWKIFRCENRCTAQPERASQSQLRNDSPTQALQEIT